ncbi:ABC transporter permease [Bacillus sp. UNC437CL72CviS29]|uniref:ABC transporter permease n=1 Tax=Bacillus sp. UNC437CL72CviS29 TaxID=1340430 RepID=UPI0004796974|nr:ABC transporter permease [Bacillus sp. UNC437CL72CviS29]
MSLLDSIKIALSSILAHKLRSALTMLGIIIGVGSIITVVAIGQGGEAALKSQFVGSGNSVISINYSPDMNDQFAMGEMGQPKLTEEDIFEIKKLPEIAHVIKTNSNMETLDVNDKKDMVNIKGLDSEYFAVNKVKVKKGRSLNDTDVEQGNNVIMISTGVEKKIFEKENPVGAIIEIKGQPMQIIGVYEAEGGFMGMGGDSEALIPLTLWPTLYGKDEIENISVQAKNVDHLEVAGKKAAEVLNNRKPSEFTGKYEVMNLKEIQDGISKMTNTMTMIIGGIAGISLVVGGIGVMNIMLVSVTERTREIGVRKALGATRSKILLQFLIEAVMLTLLGGLIGIGLGYGGAHIVSSFANWPPLVSWQVVVGGVLFSMTLGIIFGLIPANKAAKLDPIDALRYE